MLKSERKSFKRVLIANRGEIAVRIARTLREMAIAPVAIYSEADRRALHVQAADIAYCVGASTVAESYLKGEQILKIAREAKVDAIHPGYGFLSENADFAEEVESAGITFIGPSARSMRLMGSKTAARQRMIEAGVPVVPGSDGPVVDAKEAQEVAARLGYPVLLKASAGGGGKGMRMVDKSGEMISAFRSAASEAASAFADATVYVEKALLNPRHIEIQVLSGPDGKAIWLGERECSMQRRHQKVIEETPSPFITESLRRTMGEVACRAADAVNYVGAGTVEFLVDSHQNFYFLEMNTRLQVEHAVTEMCVGIDLVEAQICVAQGYPLAWQQSDIVSRGHSIEARIYAEDPANNFLPSPGVITDLHIPHWPHVRIDAGVEDGSEVTCFYDPMIAKVIVWAESRSKARRRLLGVLRETAINGLTTNAHFLTQLIESRAFADGEYHTGSVEATVASDAIQAHVDLKDLAAVAATVHTYRRDRGRSRQTERCASGRVLAGWRLGFVRRETF